jgi:cytochrome c553
MAVLLSRCTAAWFVSAIITACGFGQNSPAAAPTTVAMAPLPAPEWAFPGPGEPAAPLTAEEKAALLSVANSSARFTRPQLQDPFAPPDWHPQSHTAMPPIVAAGHRPKVMACGYCHLPDGSGRPENCFLSGLPAPYLEQQIAAFRDGSRDSAVGDAYAPAKAMRALCADLAPADVADAARYFSAQHPATKLTVRETSRLSAPRAYRYIYALDRAATESIDGRIIETTDDLEGHERRDTATPYIAYVPVGAIERGRRLAAAGPAGAATSCFTCHGPDLKGTPQAPPLAGHFASYVFRQLLAFRNGARHDVGAAPMAAVVAPLSVDDMVDLAAYAAAQPR